MPTGYTAKLMESGQTFEEFAMLCSREFKACQSMKEAPLSESIPEYFDPYEGSKKALEEEQTKLDKMLAFSEEEKEKYGAELIEQELIKIYNALRILDEQNKRLEDMEVAVNRWMPPSVEHVPLKDFMLSQIRISKNHKKYYEMVKAKLVKTSPMDMYKENLERTRGRVNFYTENFNKEIQRVESANMWLKLLRESLKQKN